MLEAYPDNRLARILLWSFCALVMIFLMLPTLVVVPLSFSASNLLEFPPQGPHALEFDIFREGKPPVCRPGDDRQPHLGYVR